MELIIKKTMDFELDGKGSAVEWVSTQWQSLSVVNGNSTYKTQAKTLYSDKGIYFLVKCEDNILTCTLESDLSYLFNEDVVEVFLWPDESQTLYFEYEISPLGYELPILVPNHKGNFLGWLPWLYEGGRKVRKATSVTGGQKSPMAEVEGWVSEFFIPYAILQGMGNAQPVSGSSWRANIYRIDYDNGNTTQWAWCPDTGPAFHQFRDFGTFVFE